MKHSIIVKLIMGLINKIKIYSEYSRSFKILNSITETLACFTKNSKIIGWIVDNDVKESLYSRVMKWIENMLKALISGVHNIITRGMKGSLLFKVILGEPSNDRTMKDVCTIIWGVITTYSLLSILRGRTSNIIIIIAPLVALVILLPIYIKGYEIFKNSRFIRIIKGFIELY